MQGPRTQGQVRTMARRKEASLRSSEAVPYLRGSRPVVMPRFGDHKAGFKSASWAV